MSKAIMDRAAMAAEIERDEGRRRHLYRCTAGKLTIGVGWNIEDRGLPADTQAAAALPLTWWGVRAG